MNKPIVNGSEPPIGFYALLGSYFGDWNFGNDFMRATLSGGNFGFAAVYTPTAHWRFEAMAAGDCFGTGLTRMVNDPFPSGSDRGRYLTIMGDPTLRLEMVLPPQGLHAQVNGNIIDLGWTAISGVQYYVYRSNNNVTGSFTRISSLLSTGSFQDNQFFSNSVVYMVRAVVTTTSGSGSYVNLSHGVFYPAQ